MLSQKAIEEFLEIYFKTYGERLLFDEAVEQATRLINLYKAVLGESEINDKHNEPP